MTNSLHTCLFCGHPVQLVHVHGHYQCPVCHTNALPCCDGDNCDTNLLLKAAAEASAAENKITEKETP
jgi:hypothetical protein